jgi:cell division septal protein FtsQ
VIAVIVLAVPAVAASRLVDTDAFPVGRVDVQGAVFTDRAAVETILRAGADNVFRYDAAAAAAQVAALPTVRHASVRVALPDLVVATVEERVPVVLWTVGDDKGGFLADADGLLFAHVTSRPTGLPRVDDRRAASGAIGVGDRLGAIDLRAARALLSVTPSMLGTGAAALAIAISDADGFEVTTQPASWTAVFGPYGEVTRSPDLVPVQVQCLASLLAAGPESRIGRVVLSPDGQACGTYAPPKKS